MFVFIYIYICHMFVHDNETCGGLWISCFGLATPDPTCDDQCFQNIKFIGGHFSAKKSWWGGSWGNQGCKFQWQSTIICICVAESNFDLLYPYEVVSYGDLCGHPIGWRLGIETWSGFEANGSLFHPFDSLELLFRFVYFGHSHICSCAWFFPHQNGPWTIASMLRFPDYGVCWSDQQHPSTRNLQRSRNRHVSWDGAHCPRKALLLIHPMFLAIIVKKTFRCFIKKMVKCSFANVDFGPSIFIFCSHTTTLA